MATGLGALLDLQEDSINTKVEEYSDIDLLTRIDMLNKSLDEKKDIRKEINLLKYAKDELIKEYIENTVQPFKLKLRYINYKALFFYFKKHFIETTKTVSLNTFSESEYEIKEEFKDFFNGIQNISYIIQTLYTNFPHLIGFKNGNDGDGKYINSKLNEDFLNKIFYETNLIDDYKTHGCDLDKIQALSWIDKTLKKPNYIFNKQGVASTSKLEGSLIFVRIVKGTVHYVSLIKISDNYLVINSQHSLSISKYQKMFIETNAIVKRK